MKRTALLLAACLVALPLHAAEGDKKDDARRASVKSDTVTLKTTVEAIDHTHRTVTLREKDGDMVTLHASPDIQGFDTLNVGDKVTFRYTEAVALQLHKADEKDMDRSDRTATPPSGAPGDGRPGSGPQPQPGSPTDQPGAPGGGAGSGAASPSGSTTGSETPAPGMSGEQVTALVTVKDVDTKDPSITFETEDGRTVSTRVDDRNLVKDIDPGDQIEITYTNALLVSVEK